MALNLFFLIGFLVARLSRALAPVLSVCDPWRLIATSVTGAFGTGVVASAVTSESALDGSLHPYGLGFAALGASTAVTLHAYFAHRAIHPELSPTIPKESAGRKAPQPRAVALVMAGPAHEVLTVSAARRVS